MHLSIQRRIQALLYLLVLCFCGRSLWATTYYVDSAKGKDSNSGTSSQSAWQTLARVNIAALLPGDAVLLASNGVWHEQLTVSHSGTAAAPITFSSYGGSQEPIIDGADVVTGWNLVGGNTYNAIYHAKAYKGFVDSLYEQAPSLQPVASLAQVKAAVGSIFSDGEYVYVHLADGSSPAGHVVEVSGARMYNIVATSQSHLVFNGLELARAARSGFLANSNVDNSGGLRTNEYVSLNAMTVFNWGNALADYGTDGGMAGIYVFGFPASTQTAQRGWTVKNGYCGVGDVKPVLAYHVGCIDLEGTVGAVIDHNVVAAINALGIAVSGYYNGDPCASPTVSNNEVTMSEGNIRVAGCPNAVVSGNRIHDSNGYGIGVGGNAESSYPQYSTNAHLLSNTIVNLRPTADGKLYNGVDCNTGASGGIADGNVIQQVSGNNLTLEGDSFVPGIAGQPCSGWTLSNNTFDASTNWTENGSTPGRTGPLYIRDISIPGLALVNNTYIMNTNYVNGMTYGFTSAADWSHDLTLQGFEAIAPNHGGAAAGSH